jgi:hypothetical protein
VAGFSVLQPQRESLSTLKDEKMVGGGRGGVGALHGMAPSFLHQKYTFLSAEWLPDKITTDDPEPQNKSIITTFALL